MEAPGCPKDPPSFPRRRRRERTVYSARELRELEKVFARNQYPSYQQREELANLLQLQEHQVQVWFKNRRSKHSKLLRLGKCQGWGACPAPQGPGSCAPAPQGPGSCAPAPQGPGSCAPAPQSPGSCALAPQGPVSCAPAPALAGPEWPRGPVIPEGSGFCRPPPPSPFGVFPASESGVSSQAWWGPGQGAQNLAPAVPAPAPAPVPALAAAWPQGLYSSFSPDPAVIHGYTELSSPQDPFEGPSSSSMSGSQEGDGSVEDKDSSPRTFLSL